MATQLPTYQPSSYGKWYPGDPGKADSQLTLAHIVQAKAQKYNVPPAVIWGVLGKETDFGRNIKTSSAGAKGIGQFMPGTAPLYDYPYQNSNDIGVLAKQIDSTAYYLSDLVGGGKQDATTWETALRSYSGGGYGLKDVLKKGASNPKNDFVAPQAEAVQSTNDIVKLFGLIAGGAVLGRAGAAAIGAGEAAAGGGAAAAEGEAAAAGAGAGAGAAAGAASKVAGGASGLLAKGALVAVLAEVLSKYGVRLLEILVGVLLSYMGLRALTDHLGTPLPRIPRPL